MGDSIYLILRCVEGEYKLYKKTVQNMHDFLTPYQVGQEGDDPKDHAITNTFELKNNDIIILATDGYIHYITIYSLWDNLEHEEVIKIINDNIHKNILLNPDELAKEIADEAERKSGDKYS